MRYPTTISAFVIFASLIFVLPVITAADVTDPTRPLFLKAKKPAPVVKRKPVVKHAVQPVEKPMVYRLTSTLVSQQRRVAVINNQVVTVGDTVGRAVVVAIKPAVVHLKSGNKQIELVLAVEKIAKTGKHTAHDAP